MSPNTTRRVRVALLSFAHPHALAYARILSDDSDIELIATDPDGASAPDATPRGRALADQLGIEYVENLDAAFAWGPDAVIVTTETVGHRDVVVRAANAGVHVLCEKPLATTVADALAMVEATEIAGVVLMTAYPVRFSPAYRDVRNLIRNGEVGEVLALRGTNNGKLPASDRQWFVDPQLSGGGALMDHVVHCADLFDDLLGIAPVNVRAVTNSILHEDQDLKVETGGLVTVQYPNGVIATIDCSWSYPDSAATWGEVTLQVIGTLGIIDVAPFAQHLTGHDKHGSIWSGVGDDLDQIMLREFITAIQENRPAHPDGHDGVRTLQIVAAAQESAISNQSVPVT